MTTPKTTDNPDNISVPTLFEDKGTSHDYAHHRHSYTEELFQVIVDYCRESNQDLDLAVDVGCGPGNSTTGFTKHFKQVIGVDISESQIAQAPTNIPNCKFKVGSSTNLHFLEDGSVDLVSIGLAFNLMQKKETLAEADRVLRPGGTLAIFGYGLPMCTDPRMDQLIQWMHNVVIPYVGRELLESWERYKDQTLDYPGWIRNDDLVIPQKISPQGIVGLAKLHRRFMVENGHSEPNFVPEVEKRLTAILEKIRKRSDGETFELRFPAFIIMGHKP